MGNGWGSLSGEFSGVRGYLSGKGRGGEAKCPREHPRERTVQISMKDYESLYVVAMICAILVNIHTHTKTDSF